MARRHQDPSLEGIDWKPLRRRRGNIDRNETAVIQGTHVGYFQHLMNFMGFTEGLVARLRSRKRSTLYTSIWPNTIGKPRKSSCTI